MMFGNSDSNSYELGLGSQSYILYSLHMITAFIIMIHLLNMLIAIMGNTFTNRSTNIDKIYYRDHLNFVLDNWYLINTAFGGHLKEVKYIFAALAVEDEH